jgi:hypothetical protein
MKKVSVLLMFLVVQGVFAQSAYEKGMQKAFQLWGANKAVEASNTFERIAKAEKENWLPSYYAAQVNIVSCFGEKDESVLSAKLKKAQELLDASKYISKNNAEIVVMQAILHTAWIAFDGATYGATLSGKVAAQYGKAAVIAPNNPRVVFCKAEWDMGAARFFGKDTAPYCKDIERSIELFSKFENDTPFYPKWGKERAVQIANNCK